MTVPIIRFTHVEYLLLNLKDLCGGSAATVPYVCVFPTGVIIGAETGRSREI